MWLTNRSGDAYLEILKMAVDTSQHTTALIGSHLSTRHRRGEGKILYFRSGKPEADSSFEVYHKLHHCGCRNISLNWFKSYLTERSQYVVINDTISKTLRITTGVPQGSVLGPLLFLIYMNDLSRATDKFKYILFADDTNLISNTCSFKNNSSQNNIDQISLNINVELGKISDWMSANKLSLNTIIFSYRQKKMGENKIPTLNTNGTPIERKREAHFLGLFINEHMTWNTHIFNITKTITKTLGVINRLRHYLPQRILQILYNSLILSHLNINITAWGFTSHKLCRLQKRALRLITDSRYNAIINHYLKH